MASTNKENPAIGPDGVELTPELRVDLERRLREFEADPEAGLSWEQVKARLRDGTWRAEVGNEDLDD